MGLNESSPRSAATRSAPCFGTPEQFSGADTLLLLVVEAVAPLEHLISESLALPVDTVPALCILQNARNDRPQLELDFRKRGATFPLILNVLAHRLSQ